MLPSIQLSQVARRDVAFGSRFSTFRRSASPDSRSSHSPPRPSRAPKGCTLQIASGGIFRSEFNKEAMCVGRQARLNTQPTGQPGSCPVECARAGWALRSWGVAEFGAQVATVTQMDTSERWKPKRNATFRFACDDSCKKNNESECWIGIKKINELFLLNIFTLCSQTLVLQIFKKFIYYK